MFQVAAVVGMAYSLDMIPAINVRRLTISKYFDFPNSISEDIKNALVCKEKGVGIYSVCKHSNKRNVQLKGLRQSWKYFAGAETFVRKVFVFKKQYIKEAKSFLSHNSKPSHKNVCIHVRRGDFTYRWNRRQGFAIPDMKYFSKAMQFYTRKLKAVHFIVLSDGMQWCRDQFREEVTFSPYRDRGIDMAIMSMCDHMIISSGTFGWWGAWLSKGTVVYYNGYPRNGSELSGNINKEDYYPPYWVGM